MGALALLVVFGAWQGYRCACMRPCAAGRLAPALLIGGPASCLCCHCV